MIPDTFINERAVPTPTRPSVADVTQLAVVGLWRGCGGARAPDPRSRGLPCQCPCSQEGGQVSPVKREAGRVGAVRVWLWRAGRPARKC